MRVPLGRLCTQVRGSRRSCSLWSSSIGCDSDPACRLAATDVESCIDVPQCCEWSNHCNHCANLFRPISPPPPIHARAAADNYEEVNKICWGGNSLAAIVMASRDWELVNDGSKQAKRMAYVAQQVTRLSSCTHPRHLGYASLLAALAASSRSGSHLCWQAAATGLMWAFSSGCRTQSAQHCGLWQGQGVTWTACKRVCCVTSLQAY
jgi:hypothetical protein